MRSNNKYFQKSKKIPIDKFFLDVLYNKRFGYYSCQYPFDKKGDFVTAPSISFLFSEMIAIWLVSCWISFKKPNNFNIIELGPGNGELSKILHKTIKKFPDVYKSSNFYLYEKSNFLKNIQKKKLINKKFQWISSFEKIRKGPTIFIGNEFFDAIPIKQFTRKKGVIFEEHVFLNKKNKIERIHIKAKPKEIKELKKFSILDKIRFIEFPKLGLKLLKTITKKIKKSNGGILLIDYGYIEQNNYNTLQSVRKHKKNNIFFNLGNAEVTSLVNFTLLKNFFKKEKLSVKNVVTQSFFLKKIGIINRAEILSTKMSFKEKSDLYFRLKRLLSSSHMGELFKVIFACKATKTKIIGFD